MADPTPFAAALRTVKDGLSARAGLAAARQAGIRVQDSTWFRMVSEVKRNLSDQITEVTRPLNRRPTPDEIMGFASKKARGYMHYLDIMVKDRATGQVAIRPYSVRSRQVLTRAKAVAIGLKAFQDAIVDNPAEYDEQVLGAVHTATYQFVPVE